MSRGNLVSYQKYLLLKDHTKRLGGELTEVKKELEKKEAERVRVQCKLTDICSDIWDLAKKYQVPTDAEGCLNEEQATLWRIVAKLEAKKRADDGITKDT